MTSHTISQHRKADGNRMGSFKFQFSVSFVTSCYVIMNISIARTIDKLKLKIT